MKPTVTVKRYDAYPNGKRGYLNSYNSEEALAEARDKKFRKNAEFFEEHKEYPYCWDWEDEVVECGFLSERLYSDVHAHEVVRVVSPKCLEVRRLEADLVNGKDLEFHVGGFSAHCANSRAAKFKFSRNPENGVFRVRLNKRGEWALGRRRFFLTEVPYEFYDFNF